MNDKIGLVKHKRGRIKVGAQVAHDFSYCKWPFIKSNLHGDELVNIIFDCKLHESDGSLGWWCTANGFGKKEQHIEGYGNGAIFVSGYESIEEVTDEFPETDTNILTKIDEPYVGYFSVKKVEAFPRDCIIDDKISSSTKIGDPGYQVKYSSGYTSWCPKEQFEKDNFRCDDLPFSLAFEALKNEHLISKRSWSENTWLEPYYITNISSDYNNDGVVNIILPTIMICTREENNEIYRQLWQPSLTSMITDEWYIYDDIFEEDNNK